MKVINIVVYREADGALSCEVSGLEHYRLTPPRELPLDDAPVYFNNQPWSQYLGYLACWRAVCFLILISMYLMLHRMC